VSDDWRPGTVNIRGRRPDLLPQINLDDSLRVKITANSVTAARTYRVSDSQFVYGINSAADYWTLDGEDALAKLGRATYTATWTTSQTVSARMIGVCAAAGLNPPIAITSSWNNTYTQSSATFDQAPALDVFQRLMNTEQGLVYATADDILIAYRGWQDALTRSYMSDDGVGTNPGTYQDLEFRSMLDNYATKVVSTNDTLTEYSGMGDIVFGQPTFAFDATTLQQIAQYVKGVLSVQAQTPNRMAVLLNAQTTSAAMNLMDALSEVALRFRGTVYYCFVEGYTVSSDFNSTRINFYLSDSSFYKFLVLNDALYGTLDYNKLGF